MTGRAATGRTGPLAGPREARWAGPAPGYGLPAGHPCAAASG
jgi:hypothetical protein